MFEIEDVPMPKKPSNKKTGITDFLKSMEIGKSFLVDSRDVAYSAAYRARVSIMTKKENGKIRVWRTE